MFKFFRELFSKNKEEQEIQRLLSSISSLPLLTQEESEQWLRTAEFSLHGTLGYSVEDDRVVSMYRLITFSCEEDYITFFRTTIFSHPYKRAQAVSGYVIYKRTTLPFSKGSWVETILLERGFDIYSI